ncbi:DUF6265 family protein [Parasphingopyxis lamellibrachiae]|uniref:DUF6265 domain-containing protein n=1 Tax=Parasphingopyxis lamellibrachiae TaxID=680125 RepID=A0A3D9FIG2_9SPHN|nr:DUF6265 family protein [Parasphingopyxis lamellibrachiae]RED17408.1 hypothetical protein DFR46_2455 [Parasphingopyxis lamellibrachiae]
MRLIMIAALLLPSQLAAQDVRSLGDAASPPATLDQVAWLAGSWRGTGLGGESHESWLPPVHGQMAGIFHQGSDSQLQFYEILQMVERDGSLVLRLKHFNGDLSGWEDNGAESALEFPLVAIENDTAYFSGLTYERIGDDQLLVHLRLRSNGETRIETFDFTRID